MNTTERTLYTHWRENQARDIAEKYGLDADGLRRVLRVFREADMRLERMLCSPLH